MLVVTAASLSSAPLISTQVYQEGISPTTMLALRFSVPAIVFWVVVLATRRRLPRRRVVVRGLLQGAVLYAAQALCFFTAIQRVDVSIATVIFYVYPALVFLIAVPLGRDRFSWLRLTAVPFAIGGVSLAALGGGLGGFDAVGSLLALASALVYVGFTLHGDSLSDDADPIALVALLSTGAVASFVAYGLASGELHGPVSRAGLGWIVAVGCTSIVAYATFFAGIRLVGPSLTSILCMLEPVFVLVVAGAVLGVHLAPLQIAGAVVVLTSVAGVNVAEVRRARGT